MRNGEDRALGDSKASESQENEKVKYLHRAYRQTENSKPVGQLEGSDIMTLMLQARGGAVAMLINEMDLPLEDWHYQNLSWPHFIKQHNMQGRSHGDNAPFSQGPSRT